MAVQVTMQQVVSGWSEVEQEAAQAAFQQAYQREVQALIDEVRSRSSSLSQIEELWSLHDFLSARRHEIDGKYDYDYSGLLFTFARLVKDGWLSMDELTSLEKDKRAKIMALTRM
jgi:hypothetical protein